MFLRNFIVCLTVPLVWLGCDQACAEKIKVLLIEGATNHNWEKRKDILRAILSKEGSFDIDVSITPATAGDPAWATWSPVFTDYDVVVSGYSNSAVPAPRWPTAVETALISYVQGGGGFIAFHEASSAFEDWPEYREMIGIGWHNGPIGKAPIIDAEGSVSLLDEGQGTYTFHGPNADTLVKRIGNHPIHNGLPPSWMAANLEVVNYLRGPANNLTVISYANDPVSGTGFPIEWTVEYGTGRVYSATYGHVFAGETEPEGMRCAAFQETFIRALKWCAQVDPGTTMPADFPSPTAISLRDHAEGITGFGGPKPVAPFANGALPTLSIVPTGVDVVPAFTNLLWESPIDAKPWPGTTDQIMIVETDGRIFKLTDDDLTTTRDLVLDITERVWYQNWDVGANNTKHGGLQTVVFHPLFGQGQNKDFIYAFYLHHPTDDPNAQPPYYTRLSRFTWNGTVFDPTNELIMINQYDTVKGHDGGGLAFGADGFLYITFGDEGTAGADANGETQKIDDRPRSGVWRIDVDMQGGAISHPIRRQPFNAAPSHGSYTQGYYIPSDNPWAQGPEVIVASVLEEFYAIGLREPHRMSFDAVTGFFWIGDVGASNREEIDVMDMPGLNFEWNYKEGIAAGFRVPPFPLIGIAREPIHDYSHAIGNCVIGGHVYRGDAIDSLKGKYIYGDNGTQLLYAIEYDPDTLEMISVQQFGQGRAGNIWTGISSFGIDSSGESLLLQMGAGVNGGGLISRIKPQGAPGGGTWEYPELLSQTGVFADVATLTPVAAMIPYDVNMPLWSAGMDKKRWVMIPNDGIANSPAEQITYSENDQWELPIGTVFVKHFSRPENQAPLETRLMVHGTDGWGGVTYKWLPDGSDAYLLEEGGEETITRGATNFEYLYPSRQQCFQCHSNNAGPVLGFRTRQLNRDFQYPGGLLANQIESFSVAGFIPQNLTAEQLVDVITSADIDDPQETDMHRARSYLDSNCAHCHQPGGSSRAFFDTRLSTPLENQSLLCGTVIEGFGLPAPAVIKPGSIENSVLLARMNTIDDCCSMPPLAKGIIDHDAVATIANWILSMDADSCTKTSGFYGAGEIGITGPTPPGVHGPDGWNSNLVINESGTFTNTTGAAISLLMDRFRFNAGRVGDPVTPFIVRVNADNNFTVLAIGTTRTAYQLGGNDFAFSDSPVSIPLKAGETIAIGFLDANADGSGGTGQGIIDWRFGGASIWYSGGDFNNNSGSITLGQAPVPGTQTFTNLNRDYFFSISYIISEYQMGNPPPPPDVFLQVDGARSNLVINTSDGFTNQSDVASTVTVDRFRFHATRVTDPITPFIAKKGPGNAITIVAIGKPVTTYQIGSNDVEFSDSVFRLTIGPGETIAPGFIDYLPDGTGGTQVGAITFSDGINPIVYCYAEDDIGCVLTLGAQPVFNGTVTTLLPRDYVFSISLGFGGPEDEDGDGLPDRWELAFSDSLDTLSGDRDSDGDGMTDAQELAAGTDPLDPTSVLRTLDVRPSETVSAVSSMIQTVPGRLYQIEASTDLINWSTPREIKAASWPAESTTISLPYNTLPEGSENRLFIRVRPSPR